MQPEDQGLRQQASRPNAPAMVPDPGVVAEARALVKDLFRRDRTRFSVDLLVTAAIAYAATATYLVVPVASPLGLAALAVAVFALFRAAVFIHEIAHFPRGAMPGFVVAWNLLVGIPFCTPSHFYGNHLDHHSTPHYGTPRDGEYLPFARAPRVRIILYFLQPLMLPPLAVVRFLLLAPASALVQRLRRWVLRRATSYVTNPYYRRADPLPGLGGWRLVAELGSGLVLALLLGSSFTGRLPGTVLLKLYAVAVLAVELNWLRNLAGHRFVNDGRSLTTVEQFADSITVLGSPLLELLFPVGLRYHALHHLFPGIPYHNLAQGHRRLLAGLSAPARAVYVGTFRDGIGPCLAELWRSARATADRSMFRAWREGAAPRRGGAPTPGPRSGARARSA